MSHRFSTTDEYLEARARFEKLTKARKDRVIREGKVVVRDGFQYMAVHMACSGFRSIDLVVREPVPAEETSPGTEPNDGAAQAAA